jgi:hypothetical protein
LEKSGAYSGFASSVYRTEECRVAFYFKRKPPCTQLKMSACEAKPL